jgi:hypothetical protein
MGTFDYFNRKPWVITGEGGEISYTYYEIPFEFSFEEENDFDFTFKKEA